MREAVQLPLVKTAAVTSTVRALLMDLTVPSLVITQCIPNPLYPPHLPIFSLFVLASLIMRTFSHTYSPLLSILFNLSCCFVCPLPPHYTQPNKSFSVFSHIILHCAFAKYSFSSISSIPPLGQHYYCMTVPNTKRMCSRLVYYIMNIIA